MKVLMFGATGMVGQGVLRECLLDAGIELVQTVGRTGTGIAHPKLRDVVLPDLFRCADIESELLGFDACFYCLGVSSVGVPEPEYERLTYSLTMAVAETLSRLNPAMTFVFVSGAGADSSERGPLMWARVKGKTENALQRLPFRAAFAFRPAAILPVNGERSRTRSYRIGYALTRPLFPLLRLLPTRVVVTTEDLSRAMVQAAEFGAPKRVLESSDIDALAKARTATMDR